MQESTDAPAAAASNHGVHGVGLVPRCPVRNEALPLAAAAAAASVVLSMIAATMQLTASPNEAVPTKFCLGDDKKLTGLQ